MKTKRKIAIDVVLLPSEKMMDFAIRLNKRLLKTTEPIIVLDKKACIPHLSLAMGCIETEKIPLAANEIAQAAQRFTAFTLKAEEFTSSTIPNGKRDACLTITNTSALQALHNEIMRRLRPYVSYDVARTMLVSPPPIDDVTFFWIRNYAKKHANPELFKPHITIGIGEAHPLTRPITFTASELALCQLGNYCTCRKVFSRFRIHDDMMHRKEQI